MSDFGIMGKVCISQEEKCKKVKICKLKVPNRASRKSQGANPNKQIKFKVLC